MSVNSREFSVCLYGGMKSKTDKLKGIAQSKFREILTPTLGQVWLLKERTRMKRLREKKKKADVYQRL